MKKTNENIGKKVYAIIHKPYGFVVIKAITTDYYPSVEMYSVKEINSTETNTPEYIIKACRIFTKNIDAVKYKNTLTDFSRKGHIPALL